MMKSPKIVLRDDNLMTTGDLLAMGYHDKAITRLVKRGELVRIRQGAYVFAEAWRRLDEEERHILLCRAVLRRARKPTLLTGPSAARALAVPVWDLGDDVHVNSLDRKADRRNAGRRPHRGDLLVEDTTIRNGLPITAGTRTALEIIEMTDEEHALVVVDGLLHTRETTIPLLERRAAGMAHDPGSLNVPVVLMHADGRHESAGETRTSWMLRRALLPRPEPQYEIRDRSGRVVHRVDFAWPELRVFLEFDGKEKYLKYRRKGESVADCVLREKRREELVCGLTGWRCIRIVWADLYRPELIVARIVATMRGETWAA
ncbi:type IV toxin-antitoxin system AbiEi family antitoxin domain-containing protein [Nocardioides aquiterrae]|uniref:Type IV toxin-antitoxin system AbiEi family antitoxin domain-containing protein n=1 Tax=Nocardioides aquiterrae TaxID=203799 RepID=A0ABN1UE80_9ACTN